MILLRNTQRKTEKLERSGKLTKLRGKKLGEKEFERGGCNTPQNVASLLKIKEISV